MKHLPQIRQAHRRIPNIKLVLIPHAFSFAETLSVSRQVSTRSASAWNAPLAEITNVNRPSRLARSRLAISASVTASTDVVGSMSTRIGGRAATARASAIRWRWPPESPRHHHQAAFQSRREAPAPRMQLHPVLLGLCTRRYFRLR